METYNFFVSCTLTEKVEAASRADALRKFEGQRIDKLGNHPGIANVKAEDITKEKNNYFPDLPLER